MVSQGPQIYSINLQRQSIRFQNSCRGYCIWALQQWNFCCPLISSYARTGDIHFARKVFENLPRRGIHSWNAMLVSYSRGDEPLEVLNLYKKMSLERVKPDSSTFTVAIKPALACWTW
ncbi:UNVERIFIED_CONTAM: putative pentatricopeptide repeat-containing protein, mitochondrial [Sesamum latifolium]|uniref:Pentatricopeptide repeat-containing protein, mitochondrial n=1 Tax=Sesamum latifolium TaxID=2727402 RepID=A0AAW2Y2Q4_9LAMI